jgi:hypothetical protein
MEVPTPDGVLACMVVVGTTCIVVELSDELAEVIRLELGPEETCAEVTMSCAVVTLVGALRDVSTPVEVAAVAVPEPVVELLDVTTPVAIAEAVVMEPSDMISGPWDDDVEP